jgi:bifunctional UDP-N-acetylglucosamine pyrophosphorylase/glucosamine-1-phosphate N-acetyltransferase
MSALFNDPTNYGRIVRDEQGNLKAIVEEKDASDAQKKIKEINTGVYLLDWAKVSQSFLEMDSNNAQNEYYLTDIVKWTISHGLKAQSYILENNEESYGINSKKHLAQATKILKDRVLENLMAQGVTIVDPDTTYISPDTEIEADTEIYPCTYIEGKNKIGKNCKIGPFARVRGDVELGDFVKIGNFVEIKKSKIDAHTNVCHLSYIGDSKLGADVNIGAGTITANYNHITKQKSQTVIENNASTGSNSVLVAPVCIGENASVAAGSVISKDLEANSLGLTRAPLKVIKGWFDRCIKK